MSKKKLREGIVFSTDPNFHYEYEGKKEPPTLEPNKQKLYVRKEVRNGKPCAVIKEFIGKSNDLESLAKKLKTSCGTGGSAKDGDIIIQGDIAEKIKTLLKSWGYGVK